MRMKKNDEDDKKDDVDVGDLPELAPDEEGVGCGVGERRALPLHAPGIIQGHSLKSTEMLKRAGS